MAYDLERLARQAGVKVSKLLAAIEVTQSLEDELFQIIYPVAQAYQQAVNGIASAWVVNQLARQTVESILSTNISPARAREQIQATFVEGWSNRVERWHRTRWVGVVRGGLRLDITPILDMGAVRPSVEASVARNVELIKGLSDEAERRIRTMVWTAYQDGTNGRQLAKDLTAAIGFTKSRARLIARDQLAKFADSLDSAGFAEGGLAFYIWKTVGDDVVRPTHKRNNGKRFRNDTPPKVAGHPGHDVNCRCKRQAVIYSEAEAAEVDAAEARARAMA